MLRAREQNDSEHNTLLFKDVVAHTDIFLKVSEEEKKSFKSLKTSKVLKEDEAEKDECCTTYSTISKKFYEVNPNVETITDRIYCT